MTTIKKIKKCEVCKSSFGSTIHLGSHPMCDDLIKIGSRKRNIFYPVVLKICETCLTVAQKYHIKREKLFPKKYHYRARLTKDVINGQKDLVNEASNLYGNLKNKVVLDVGANDCSLLNEFKKRGSITLAIEPTNAIQDGAKNHRKFQSYFDKHIVSVIKKKYPSIDFITFTNVFAHINDLNSLLVNLKNLLNEKTVVIIENHYIGSVLEKKQFDTFYSEHLRTYSFNSFIYIAKFLGLKIDFVQFPRRYGGNIRVFLSKQKDDNFSSNQKQIKNILLKEKLFLEKFKKLNIYINRWKIKKKKIIYKYNRKYGPLPAKAFPGRAAIILCLLGLTNKNISLIYEKPSSKKIGYYAPGTKIEITSDNRMQKEVGKKPIINLAWHIDKEIKQYLKANKIKNKIITIIEPRDFLP